MHLDSWIKKYNAKTPEPFSRDLRYDFYFKPDKGFCELGMNIDGDMIMMNQLCGDARYWRDLANKAAKACGIKRCGTICIRPEIRAYIRLFGYRITKEEKLSDELIRFHCINKEHKRALVSPAFYYKDRGVQAHFVTWEP